MFDEIASIKGLTEEKRIQARQQARANLINSLGGEPQYDDFLRQIPSRFGREAKVFTVVMLVIVMVSAFIISSVHIYTVGHKTYLETGAYDSVGIMIGIFFVLLAESSILVLSIAPTVWETPPRINTLFFIGIMGSSFIAMVGNIDATLLYQSSPLDWLVRWGEAFLTDPTKWAMATLPPFLTVLVGQILKFRALSESQVRHEARQEYEQALRAWDHILSNLDDHPDWSSTWANTLWDTWCKGKRRELLAEIDINTRRLIVLREMQADNWWNADEFSGIQGNSKRIQRKDGRSQLAIAVEYLEENPHIFEGLRENSIMQSDVAYEVGVSQSTISRAFNLSKNGHSNGD